MSYLLTEIALDMLGYKFYNINGDYQVTDFQKMSGSAPSDSQEVSLEEVVYPNGVCRTADTNSVDSDECVEVRSLPIPRISVNQDHLVMLNIKESLEKEVENLREEMFHKKTKFLEDNIKIIKKKDKNVKVNPKDLLQPYSEREKKEIRGEVEMMGEFLKCVEKRLEEANPEQFKEHKRYRMGEYL